MLVSRVVLRRCCLGGDVDAKCGTQRGPTQSRVAGDVDHAPSYSFHSNASMTGVVINRAQRVPPPTPSRVEARI